MESKIETVQVEKELTSKDFCFFLQQDDTDGDTYAFFCPIEYFRNSGQMSKAIYDVLDHVVPEDMDEVQDNCYATSRSIEEVRAQLVKLGFVEDAGFNEFMDDLDAPDSEEEEEKEESENNLAPTGT